MWVEIGFIPTGTVLFCWAALAFLDWLELMFFYSSFFVSATDFVVASPFCSLCVASLNLIWFPASPLSRKREENAREIFVLNFRGESFLSFFFLKWKSMWMFVKNNVKYRMSILFHKSIFSQKVKRDSSFRSRE